MPTLQEELVRMLQTRQSGFEEGTFDFGQANGPQLASYLDSPHYAPEPDRAGAQRFLERNQPSVGQSLANSLTKNPERSQALQMLLDRVLPKGAGQTVADETFQSYQPPAGVRMASEADPMGLGYGADVPSYSGPQGAQLEDRRQGFEQLQQRMLEAQIGSEQRQWQPKVSDDVQLGEFIKANPQLAPLFMKPAANAPNPNEAALALAAANGDKNAAAALKLMGGGRDGIAVSPAGTPPDQILAKYSPEIQRKTKMLLEYKAGATPYMMTRDKDWAAAAEAASEIDPTWNTNEYPSRLKVLNDFKSGKAATNVRSLNTLIGHLDSLNKTGSKLGNSDYQMWNKGKNVWSKQTGESNVTNFEKAVIAVENEAASLFKGTGATDQEIKAWRETINSSQSPKQLREGVLQMVDLMSSRLGTLTEQYEMGMGKPKDFRLLNSKSKAILESMGVGDPEKGGVRGGGGAGAAMFAVNPTTKERITSTDGGQTWQPAK